MLFFGFLFFQLAKIGQNERITKKSPVFCSPKRKYCP